MEDMLSFISQRIKNVDGLSMQQLISSIGFTRSKFYRFLQEPQRFSDKQMEALSDALCLDDNDKQLLFQFRDGDTSGGKNDKDDVYSILSKIIFFNTQFAIDSRSKMFTLYSAHTTGAGIVRCSADDLSELISDSISREKKDNDRNTFHVRITNSYSYRKILILYSLLKEVTEIEDLRNNYYISIHHYINSASMSLADKFQAFSDLSCFFSLMNYGVKFVDRLSSFWSGTDCCLIDFLDKNGTSVYLFIIFPSDTEAMIYHFNDSTLYDFLTYNNFDSSLLFPDTTMLGDPIAINRYVIEYAIKYKKLVIDTDFCYENFTQELWTEIRDIAKENNALLQVLRAFLDPKGVWSSFPDSLFRDMLYEGSLKRHFAAEEHAQINLLYTSGLKSFAEKGYTSELWSSFFSFTDEQVLRQLYYFRERIGDHSSEKKQSYYFIDLPTNQTKTCVVYEGYSFSPYTFTGNDPFALNSVNALYEPEMSTMLYKYIVEELLPVEKRKEYTSPIMSDERAVAFIDSLIEEVEKRILAAQ